MTSSCKRSLVCDYSVQNEPVGVSVGPVVGVVVGLKDGDIVGIEVGKPVS